MTPETIGYWFFRLNGCLTITNFVLHPNKSGAQKTDADILAVRFPHRSELAQSGRPLQDHPMFGSIGTIEVFIAEIKARQCHLNGPWTDPSRENIQHVLEALGVASNKQVPVVAKAIYETQIFESEAFRLRLCALGKSKNPDLGTNITQITWLEVLEFIWQRFHDYQKEKADHSQWDETGQALWKLATAHDKEKFIEVLMQKVF